MTTTKEIGTTDILTVPGEYFAEFVEDYDHKAIKEDLHEAVNALLPEGVYLALNGMVFAEVTVADEARAIDWDEIERQIDVDGIIARHDLTQRKDDSR